MFDMVTLTKKYLNEINDIIITNSDTHSNEELATFISFAIACPNRFFVSAHVYHLEKY